jgi:hypothetical protein
MPNWCSNFVAFYHKNNATTILEAFCADVFKYQDYKAPGTNCRTSWIGHWLQSNRVNIDNVCTRGFVVSCELYDDYVCVEMETAWEPLPEIWSLMAEKYDLMYVYTAEESGCGVYINTDIVGTYFSTRYQLNYFEVDGLDIDTRILSEYRDLLMRICEQTMYFDSWKDVVNTFKPLVFEFEDIDILNRRLEILRIELHQYEYE